MALAIRPLGGLDDVHCAVGILNRVMPHDPTCAEVLVLLRASELDRLDLVATIEGEPAGVGTLAGDLNSLGSTHPFVVVVVDVPHRGRGAGTALLAELSEHARRLGKEGVHCEARADDVATLEFLERRGFEEFDRAEQVTLDVADHAPTEARASEGIEVVWLTDRPDLMAGLHAIAEQTYPETSATTVRRAGTEHEWMLYELGDPRVLLNLTTIAVAGDAPIGFSTIARVDEESAIIRMTTVLPAWRRRGAAAALVDAQIQGAARAGFRTVLAWHRGAGLGELLRKAGFVPHAEVVDLRGPLQGIGRQAAAQLDQPATR